MQGNISITMPCLTLESGLNTYLWAGQDGSPWWETGVENSKSAPISCSHPLSLYSLPLSCTFLVTHSKFYNYAVSNQGKMEKHGNDYEKDYFTDVISREAVQFIKESAADARAGKVPFFMYIATPAPHRPMTPAPQYANNFSNWSAPRTPSYGLHGDNKHWIISEGKTNTNEWHIANNYSFHCLLYMCCPHAGTPAMTSQVAGIIDDQYRDRLRTLLSVDDLVEAVVKTLEVKQCILWTHNPSVVSIPII